MALARRELKPYRAAVADASPEIVDDGSRAAPSRR
jgi:hypothetical protein